MRHPCAKPLGAANLMQRLTLRPLRRFFDDLKAAGVRRDEIQSAFAASDLAINGLSKST
jgi:hypothetical protein